MYQIPQTAFGNRVAPRSFDRPSGPTMPMQPQRQPPPQAQPQPAAPVTVPSQPQEHTDVIHDTQFDYYGQLLATASSDRTVGVYVARANAPLQRLATLSGHEGPVWMVSWAHPRFGTLLASASYDQRCFIWKESPPGSQQWNIVHVVDTHTGSVNAVEWGPQEHGPMVATAGSDGVVAVTTYVNGAWQESVKLSNNSNHIAHAIAATCVSFAPFKTALRDLVVLASGGCDCQVRLWVARPSSNTAFEQYQAITAHKDWVRDVAFCPSSSATAHLLLASCSQDKSVVLHRKPWSQISEELDSRSSESMAPANWEYSTLTFDEPVWRLSWSPSGQTLIVTTADARVFVVRQGNNFTEPWIKVPLSEYQQ